MKKSSIVFILLLFLFAPQHSKAQSNTPVLGWRTNFSYENVKHIALGEQKIFAATENTVFSVDKESGEIERLTKISGLSDVGIGAIQTLPDLSSLVIGYKNGNIDILKTNSIQNITTVKDFETTQSKEFKSIRVNGENIYLAGDLGIIIFNTGRDEITEAYQNLGVNGQPLSINDLVITNDSIFAATDNGIMAASLAPNINRQDFNNWKRSLAGISFEHIITTDFGLFASSESDLFTRKNGTWSFHENLTETITSMQRLSDRLLISTEQKVLLLRNNTFETLYTLDSTTDKINALLNDGAYIWMATDGLSLARLTTGSNQIQSYKIPGPIKDVTFNAKLFNSNIYVAPSSFTDLNEGNSLDAYSFENRQWSNFEATTNAAPIGQIIDFSELGNSVYFASFDQGLFRANTAGPSESLIDANSGPESIANEGYQLTAIEADTEGTLWVTFYDRDESFFSYNPSTNTWQNQTPSNALGKYPIDIFIGSNGDKWLTIDPERGGGILVYNETTGDERYLNQNGGQGGLPSNEVTDIELDQDFFVWVATSQGIAFFTNPNAVLNNQSLTASVPIFENRLLLRNEYITDIGIDPANRKWFGSLNNGLWLFSEAGDELIYHFTEENSPLPSNRILSLAIEPKSGEVLITTDKGAISFRSDATEGTDVHSNVKIYPNPVNPNFDDQIVIEGLVNNASVKITDVSGKLVKNIQANGSTALWNGQDLNGSRVTTGVYLVFSTNDDGTETYVSKIVVI